MKYYDKEVSITQNKNIYVPFKQIHQLNPFKKLRFEGPVIIISIYITFCTHISGIMYVKAAKLYHFRSGYFAIYFFTVTNVLVSSFETFYMASNWSLMYTYIYAGISLTTYMRKQQHKDSYFKDRPPLQNGLFLHGLLLILIFLMQKIA